MSFLGTDDKNRRIKLSHQSVSMKSWLRAHASTDSRVSEWVVFSGAVIFSLAVGISLAAGLYLLIGVVVAGLLLLAVFVRPDYAMLAMAGSVLIVAGSLQYFAGVGQFQWVVSILGVLLFVVALVRISFDVSKSAREIDYGIALLLVLWWGALVFSSAGNLLSVSDWVVGIRIFLPFLGVFLYIAYCRPPERLLKQLINFLLFVASIQWLLCVYQKIVVVPKRIAGGFPGSPWDSIVGSFGGEKFGGGESGSLGVFLSVMLIITFALYKNGAIRKLIFLWIFASCFSAIAVSEAKVVLVLVPVGLFILYKQYIVHSPVKFICGGLAVVCLVFVLLVGYNYLYWQAENQSDFWTSVVRRMSYSFDPNFRVSGNSLGRLGSLEYWWRMNADSREIFGLLVGHGLASAVSVSSLIGMGSAAKESGYILDTTGATKLLWESGLFGFLLFQSTFILAYFRAKKLSNVISIPQWHRAVLGGVQAAMAMMFLAVFYEVTTVSSPPMQLTNMLLMGYIVYWWNKTGGGKQ